MLSELRVEDAGEVRFQAGPAQSLALLEVEGKLLRRGDREGGITSALGLRDWRLVPVTLPPLSLRGRSWGGSQRATRFLG